MKEFRPLLYKKTIGSNPALVSSTRLETATEAIESGPERNERSGLRPCQPIGVYAAFG
jgi:hypothetical protein